MTLSIVLRPPDPFLICDFPQYSVCGQIFKIGTEGVWLTPKSKSLVSYRDRKLDQKQKSPITFNM